MGQQLQQLQEAKKQKDNPKTIPDTDFIPPFAGKQTTTIPLLNHCIN